MGNINETEKMLRNKRRTVNTNDTVDCQIKYLQNLIIHLEHMQAAESVKYVVDVAKPTDPQGMLNEKLLIFLGKYKFCVIFDEALCPKETWVDVIY